MRFTVVLITWVLVEYVIDERVGFEHGGFEHGGFERGGFERRPTTGKVTQQIAEPGRCKATETPLNSARLDSGRHSGRMP